MVFCREMAVALCFDNFDRTWLNQNVNIGPDYVLTARKLPQERAQSQSTLYQVKGRRSGVSAFDRWYYSISAKASLRDIALTKSPANAKVLG